MMLSFFSKTKTLPDALSWSGNAQQLEGVSQGLRDQVLSDVSNMEVLFAATQLGSQTFSDWDNLIKLFSANEASGESPLLPPQWLPRRAGFGGSVFRNCYNIALDTALTLNLYAGVIRNHKGSGSDQLFAPEGATLLEQSHYIFPLLERAFELVQMVAKDGEDVEDYKHIVINYLMLGLGRDKLAKEYVCELLYFVPELLHQGLTAHSLTDLGYLQKLLGNMSAAVDAWMRADTAASLALVGEYHVTLDNDSLAEACFTKALNKGNCQAGIRLVELYLKGLERGVILQDAGKAETGLLEPVVKTLKRALENVIALHTKKPTAFAHEHQSVEGFKKIYEPFLKYPMIKELIDLAEAKRPKLEKAPVKKASNMELVVNKTMALTLMGALATTLALWAGSSSFQEKTRFGA